MGNWKSYLVLPIFPTQTPFPSSQTTPRGDCLDVRDIESLKLSGAASALLISNAADSYTMALVDCGTNEKRSKDATSRTTPRL